MKIYTFVAGKTFNSHEKFLKKLKRGAKKVELDAKWEATIIFCPIVSRFETDIMAALTSIKETGWESRGQKVILVAMHHTYNKNYVVPTCRREFDAVTLVVNCLFHETKKYLKCSCNEQAVKTVRKELGLRSLLKRMTERKQKKKDQKNKE